MPIRVQWHDEARRIWYQEFEGHWTLGEFRQAMEQSNQAAELVAPHPLYIVANMIGPIYFPPNIIAALHQASLEVRPNICLHIIVGGGQVVQALYALPTVQKLNPHVRLADTTEEALAMIEQAAAEKCSSV
ncbi:MAG: hypothetical protein NZ750_11010 [Anaerolineae bacterium]|nr:hypothetical protein [Anaerolineae bacterium]MDW8171593.1 hypothetical protein [Anaerolineae bacterium]